MLKKIAISGGGAAGLLAASSLDSRFDVTVYEQNDRVGKKLLSTGNGRCNLMNTMLSPDRFHSKTALLIPDIIDEGSYTIIKDFFEKLGLLLCFETEGRVYPLSNQASSVLDILRLTALEKNTVIKCGFSVDKISKKGDGFEIFSKKGERDYADIVILATGGMASPKTGSDGSGYALAKMLGHSATSLSPALVPLKSDTSFTKPLKGVRAKAKITLNGSISETGEIQFTDYGISGIAAMQLSRHLKGGDSVKIDFAKDYDREIIFSLLIIAITKKLSAGELFVGILLRRIGEELIKRVLKLSPNTPTDNLTDEDLIKLTDAVKGLLLPITGTLLWDNAQVTSGGIPLGEIDTATMQSRLLKNLYILGEMLDCDGECGGYNLSWAWITALKAVKALNNL